MKFNLLISILFGSSFIACSQPSEHQLKSDTLKSEVMQTKMKVEIWSDIMCPFCYIGKRNYEKALSQFGHSDQIEVEWKSFQLDPQIPDHFDKPVNVYDYLADRKGISKAQSIAMHERVKSMAQDVGLIYNFDKAVVANSFLAHRMIQMAKSKGLGDAAEERLFRAYFTEGKNFGDVVVLLEIGKEIGLKETDVIESMKNEVYADRVKNDIMEADSIGVTGVPFFVFDRKFAVSGAQPPQVFLQTLDKAFEEWKKLQPTESIQVSEGPTCTPEGKCD